MADKLKAFQFHPRDFADNYYVYPVLSRRSQGLSIGINLNPEKDCNFKCVYCQVDRKDGRESFPDGKPLSNDIQLDRLRAELAAMLELVHSGGIWELSPFKEAPPELKRLNDIALSGDGEPTTSPFFTRTLDIIIEEIAKSGGEQPAIVIISNATRLDDPALADSYRKLYGNNGRIWAKLDAGGESDLNKVAGIQVDFMKLKSDLAEFGSRYPLVIQSCLFARGRSDGTERESFNDADYIQTIVELLQSGCQIEWIQLYTLARSTKIQGLLPLTEGRLTELKTNLTAALNDARIRVPRIEIYP